MDLEADNYNRDIVTYISSISELFTCSIILSVKTKALMCTKNCLSSTNRLETCFLGYTR